jgi:histidinol-phosphate aminotransferase
MYKVCADINDVAYRPVLLDENYQLQAQKVLNATDANTKVIWLCSPNNPTGNELDKKEMQRILLEFPGIVVIDEAYSDFSDQPPFRHYIDHFPNLIVLNTFSKAWGSASIRLGMAFASEEIIVLFNKVKYPYNINKLTQEKALQMLDDRMKVDQWVKQIKREREHVMPALNELPICKKIHPSDANFILVEVTDADSVYNYLIKKGIVVRNRNKVQLCGNCLRITIGTQQENNELLSALRQFR